MFYLQIHDELEKCDIFTFSQVMKSKFMSQKDPQGF